MFWIGLATGVAGMGVLWLFSPKIVIWFSSETIKVEAAAKDQLDKLKSKL